MTVECSGELLPQFLSQLSGVSHFCVVLVFQLFFGTNLSNPNHLVVRAAKKVSGRGRRTTLPLTIQGSSPGGGAAAPPGRRYTWRRGGFPYYEPELWPPPRVLQSGIELPFRRQCGAESGWVAQGVVIGGAQAAVDGAMLVPCRKQQLCVCESYQGKRRRKV